MEELKRRTLDIVSRDGFLAFGSKTLASTSELIGGAHQRGELPAKIKPRFVDDLLEKGVCICNREIGADEVTALERWRSCTGLAELEETIALTRGAVDSLTARREVLFQSLAELIADRQKYNAELRGVRKELGDIEDALGAAGGEDAEKIARRLAELHKNEVDAKVSERRLEDEIAELDEELELCKSELKHLRAQGVEAELIKKQKESVDNVADALEAIKNLQTDDVRRAVSSSVEEIWSRVAIKDYIASLGNDFRLSLKKRVHGVEVPVYGPSTGEKQVLALSFVASLVRKAAENLEAHRSDPGAGAPIGGEYPLVMDSAFGSLEDEYRESVAQWIPTLAQQVVLLVSNSQWKHEVESSVRERIGKEYILELHSSKAGSERAIDCGGVKYDYVVETTEPSEFTKIAEVK
ncbi:MAG: hypothetical protein IH621_17210 [Krumholzibacteria bacterium]|nr:hypothetical protein [Candidatus Krumholzibacteria bacterium]